MPLLSQFREGRVNSRDQGGLSKLRKYALRLGQMLNRKRMLFLDLAKQAERHLRAAHLMPRRIELWIREDARHQGANA